MHCICFSCIDNVNVLYKHFIFKNSGLLLLIVFFLYSACISVVVVVVINITRNTAFRSRSQAKWGKTSRKIPSSISVYFNGYTPFFTTIANMRTLLLLLVLLWLLFYFFGLCSDVYFIHSSLYNSNSIFHSYFFVWWSWIFKRNIPEFVCSNGCWFRCSIQIR